MKKFISIWISVMFFLSIALTGSFMSRYGHLEPKDTPINEILWMIWNMIWIIIPIYYVMLKALKNNE